jgi:hypothetical protein
MMSCRLARPKSGLIERQLLGDFGVATDGGIWVAAGVVMLLYLHQTCAAYLCNVIHIETCQDAYRDEKVSKTIQILIIIHFGILSFHNPAY